MFKFHIKNVYNKGAYLGSELSGVGTQLNAALIRQHGADNGFKFETNIERPHAAARFEGMVPREAAAAPAPAPVPVAPAPAPAAAPPPAAPAVAPVAAGAPPAARPVRRRRVG